MRDKYLQCFVISLFVIYGIVFLSVGAVILDVYYKFEHFLDDKFFLVPFMFIAVGSIVLITSFVGWCGAVKENHRMIITFWVLLVCSFILELAAGIAGCVLEYQAESILKEKMLHNMHFYQNTSEINKAWDFIQTDLRCCGVTNYTDWFDVLPNNSFPMSCCDLASGTLNMCKVGDPVFHNTPCLTAAEAAVDHNAVGLVTFAFIQLMGFIGGCCFAKPITMHYESI